MATYTYRCLDCGLLEVDQRFNAPPLEECPICAVVGGFKRVLVPGRLPQFVTRNPHIDGGYCSQLARFKGDPEAHYAGVDSFRRLVDKRQRQGVEILRPGQEPELSPREIKRKARKERQGG